MRNTSVNAQDRAADIIDVILARVEQSRENYYKFVAVLRERGSIHTDIVGQLDDALKDNYKRLRESGIYTVKRLYLRT